ncbi:hypothetical protein LINPERHAP2_LOCUS152, partial [Linum perenne]
MLSLPSTAAITVPSLDLTDRDTVEGPSLNTDLAVVVAVAVAVADMAEGQSTRSHTLPAMAGEPTLNTDLAVAVMVEGRNTRGRTAGEQSPSTDLVTVAGPNRSSKAAAAADLSTGGGSRATERKVKVTEGVMSRQSMDRDVIGRVTMTTTMTSPDLATDTVTVAMKKAATAARNMEITILMMKTMRRRSTVTSSITTAVTTTT